MNSKEIQFLSELTIIIPTYNRPLALERTIEYWRDLPVTVHILDGSEKPYFADGLQFETKNIYYYSFPSERETWQENWGRRLEFGTSKMTSKFSALCCDDDVFTLSGLNIAFNLLNSEEIDVVAGKAGEYLIQNGFVEWVHKYPKWQYQEEQQSSNIYERLMFQGGTHGFYAIYRSEKLIKVHRLGHMYRFPVPIWHEMLVITLIKVFCRIKFIDDIFWLKHGIAYPAARPIKFAQLFWDKQFVNHKRDFIDGLFKGIEIAEPTFSKNEIDNLVTTFTSRYKRPRWSTRVVHKVKVQILRTLGVLPPIIRKLIFACLSVNLQRRIGNSKFEVNFKPVIPLSDSDFKDDSLKNWERILLMPREELRLRANI